MSLLLSLALLIGAIGVSAPIAPLFVADGALSVPGDAGTVGEYDLPGNTVLVGHRDFGGQIGVFYRLAALEVGDEIDLSDGRRYTVVSNNTVSADDVGDTFESSNDELTLITCGGPFSVSKHEYPYRVIVRAERS